MTALGVLGALLTLVSIVSYIGFVAIQSTHKGRSCTAREAQLASELSALSARPVAGATRTTATEGCNTETPSAFANFNGPIAQSVLVAEYRQLAAGLGWQETAHSAATLLNFQAVATDGTAVLVRVWTYAPIENGIVSVFTVDAAADEVPQPSVGTASPGEATSSH